ncbi:MAG: hypothetical protein JWN89_52 [Parcubacteria group bacterium]|nr:hypothetical protein [Parcubacteria group bacterium]
MSKHNVEKMLRTELEALNNTIDMKIVRGQSYVREARAHKYLLARISQMRKVARGGFFQKLSFVPTLFL